LFLSIFFLLFPLFFKFIFFFFFFFFFFFPRKTNQLNNWGFFFFFFLIPRLKSTPVGHLSRHVDILTLNQLSIRPQIGLPSVVF